MNRKQIVILLISLIVVGGLGFWAFKNRDSSYDTSGPNVGKNLLPGLQVNEVAQITIKQSTGEVNLVKAEDIWRVKERNNYPANFNDISDFLIKAKDVKVVQSEAVGPSQHSRLELVEPGKGDKSGTLVELKDKSGKALHSLILGKKHMRKSDRPGPMGDESGFPDGRFILLKSDPNHVAVVSETFNDIEPKPANWLNKDFFKIEKPKAISLTSTNATNSWSISKDSETNDWKLADAKAGEQLDNNKATGVANSFSSPTFNDVVVNAKPEDHGLDKPTVAVFETFEGFKYTINIGKLAAEDNYPITVVVDGKLNTTRTPGKDEKPEDKEKLDKEFKESQTKLEEKLATHKKFTNQIFLVSKWTIDSLLKNRGDLMVDKKDEEKKIEGEAPKLPTDPLTTIPGLPPN